MSPPSLRRYRAERLLHSEFAGLRSKVMAIVRSQLRAKGAALDAADLEACYAMAWQGLYSAMLGGEEIENPTAWLVLVTFRRAIDESRSVARREHGVDVEQAVFDPDIVGVLDDRTRVRQVLEGLRSRLSRRECEAASLCYLQGLSRVEAAQRMGISEARMQKLMEGPSPGRPGVAGKVSELVRTISEGGWCEQQSSLMRAFAFGVLDPAGERHALASAHCRDCPACRLHVASLRGLAAVLPPLPLHLLLLGTGGGAGMGTAGVGANRAGWNGAGGSPANRGWHGVGRSLTANRAGSSGVGGSLTAKLAVTGVVLLGAGYAGLGSPSSSHAPRRPSVSPTPVQAGSEALLSPLRGGVPARFRPSPRVPQIRREAHPRATASNAPRPSVRRAPTYEFSPERVHPEALTPTSHGRPPPAAGEFGIE